MPGGLALITQDNWSAGAFQGPDTQRIPDNGTYDIINGLLDTDEGVIYRRGGGAYKSNALGVDPVTVWDGYFVTGRKTMILRDTGVWYLNPSDDTTIVQAGTQVPQILTRPVMVGNIMVLPDDAGAGAAIFYAGSETSHASYTTGTVTVTEGSAAVTGVGTTWTTNAYPGDLLFVGGSTAVVKSIGSNTTLTLAGLWSSGSATGAAYSLRSASSTTLLASITTTDPLLLGVAGNRLLVGTHNRVYFSAINDPRLLIETDYHQLPYGANVIGLEGLRGTAYVFTTAGVYAISNMAYDLTDAAGNVQQRVDQISRDIVLWDNNGIASSGNAMIVPALDDVYLMDGASSPVVLSRAIRNRYRGYVKAGYVTGNAEVFNGHYILPILTPALDWVDTLVCRLEGAAWSRLAGYSAQATSLTKRVVAGSEPLLLVARSNRVLDCTGWFSPAAANKNEPDGTTHSFDVTTRDFTLSSLKALCKKARLWTEAVDAGADAPTLTASYATGLAGSTFTSLTGTAGASTGDTPAAVWTVNAGARRVRFKFSSTSPWASLKIKALDLFVRPRSRA